jgi:hypothetical protein
MAQRSFFDTSPILLHRLADPTSFGEMFSSLSDLAIFKKLFFRGPNRFVVGWIVVFCRKWCRCNGLDIMAAPCGFATQ